MPKKQVTLDDLARMVQNGFIDVEARLGQKIDTVEQKTDDLRVEMKEHFARVDERLYKIDARFSEMNRRFDRLEFIVGGYGPRLEILEDRVKQLVAKVGLE